MRNQKLLVVIGSLMVGGTETFLVRYLSFLARQGWDIELFTLAYEPGVLAPDLQKNNVTITPLLTEEDKLKLSRYPKFIERINRIFLNIFRLSTKLRKEKNAILHLFLPEAYVLGMIAAQIARFKGPKVMSRRSLNFYQRKRPVIAWLEKRIHQYTTIVIGNSSPVVKQLHEEGIAKEKLKLIYNGLSEATQSNLMPSESIIQEFTLKESLRNTLGIQNNELVFIIVANLIPYKGHADLLKAFGLIKNKIKEPWKLICVGRDQGILVDLQQLANVYKITEHVLWLGERKDVAQLLKAADIGILCSHEEGFSNAVLEAMAAELPMVVTNVGGNAEAVLDNEIGYVVPAKNPEQLGEALLRLSSDKEQREVFGKKARQRVMEHFTLEKCVEQHIAVYQNL